MTFLELVNMVLEGSFDEGKRLHAKEWVNARLGELVDMETWSFTRKVATITTTSGTRQVTTPTDFGVALSLHDSAGITLSPIRDFARFQNDYPDETATGSPEAYTSLGGVLWVGPCPAAAETLTLVYELEHTPLDADTDVPVIPSQYHLALVHGAKAVGMRMLGIPLWNEHEQAWQQSIDAMRRKYLTTVRAAGAAVWGE